MHELSITESILEITLNHARQAEAQQVSSIYLVIGQFSSVIDDSIQFYWDIISEGTLACGASLHFRRLPAILACRQCGEEYPPPPQELACPACGSQQIKIVQGEEFYLEAIDIDKQPAGVSHARTD